MLTRLKRFEFRCRPLLHPMFKVMLHCIASLYTLSTYIIDCTVSKKPRVQVSTFVDPCNSV
jgi:hypothetical protein